MIPIQIHVLTYNKMHQSNRGSPTYSAALIDVLQLLSELHGICMCVCVPIIP